MQPKDSILSVDFEFDREGDVKTESEHSAIMNQSFSKDLENMQRANSGSFVFQPDNVDKRRRAQIKKLT
jgi:hypothetical protein